MGKNNHIRSRKRQGIKTILWIACITILLTVAVVILWHIRGVFVDERADILVLWNRGAYTEVFTISGGVLEETPLEYEALIFRGFSAYQIALAQITAPEKASYMEACINSLRKALIVKNSRMDGPIHYVLGKAYYGKGAKYADLSVKSLEAARETGFNGEDLNEYLGVAYAALRDYRNSVTCLANALNGKTSARPPDALLLALAASYKALGDEEMAGAYLRRCLSVSPDDAAKRTALFALADICFRREDWDAAESHYTAILADFGENAEAHYRLGEINAERNNQIRARAEWRKAVQIDPAHQPARARLALR